MFRARPISKRAESRHAPWLVMLAMVGVLIQALVPGAAMAAAPQAGGMVICTAEGETRVQGDTPETPRKGFAGLPCQDCLAPSMAALAAPDSAAVPLAYAGELIRCNPARRVAPPPVRDPPRPPGQGPPVSDV